MREIFMNRIKCENVTEGPIPSEKVATLVTADGTEEEVVVSRDQTQGDYLFVSPIHSEKDRVLVELPRESSSGRWRLWVNKERVEGL